jgi:hypothetical protein
LRALRFKKKLKQQRQDVIHAEKEVAHLNHMLRLDREALVNKYGESYKSQHTSKYSAQLRSRNSIAAHVASVQTGLLAAEEAANATSAAAAAAALGLTNEQPGTEEGKETQNVGDDNTAATREELSKLEHSASVPVIVLQPKVEIKTSDGSNSAAAAVDVKSDDASSLAAEESKMLRGSQSAVGIGQQQQKKKKKKVTLPPVKGARRPLPKRPTMSVSASSKQLTSSNKKPETVGHQRMQKPSPKPKRTLGASQSRPVLRGPHSRKKVSRSKLLKNLRTQPKFTFNKQNKHKMSSNQLTAAERLEQAMLRCSK